MSLLTDVVRSLPFYADLAQRVRAGEDRLVVAGGVGALPGLVLAALAEDLGRPLAIVVPDEKEAERLVCDLEAAGLTRVFHAPAPTLTPYQRIPASLKARRDEFALLSALAEPGAVEAAVLPARSLFTRLPAREEFDRLRVTLREGEEITLPSLTARLTRIGYRRADLVVETGDLAVRGGLFDAFPPDRELPVRVELDGDRVASIRVFDPDTQRSRERLAGVTLPPFAAAEESEGTRDLMTERIGRPPSEVERSVFLPAVSPMPAGWLDHAAGALVVTLEPSSIVEEIEEFGERLAGDRDPDRDVFAPEELTHPVERIREALSRAPLNLDRVGLSAGDAALLRLPAEAIPGHGGRTAEAAAELKRAIEEGEEVFVAVRPTGGA